MACSGSALLFTLWYYCSLVEEADWPWPVRHYCTSCSWSVSSVENRLVLVYCGGEKGNISEATASINQRTPRWMAQNMVKRLNACIQENCGHIQHLLWTVFQVSFHCSITKWNFSVAFENKHSTLKLGNFLTSWENSSFSRKILLQGVVWT
jgi:hypothetical protein